MRGRECSGWLQGKAVQRGHAEPSVPSVRMTESRGAGLDWGCSCRKLEVSLAQTAVFKDFIYVFSFSVTCVFMCVCLSVDLSAVEARSTNALALREVGPLCGLRTKL